MIDPTDLGFLATFALAMALLFTLSALAGALLVRAVYRIWR